MACPSSSGTHNDGGRLASVYYPSGREIRYDYAALAADSLHRVCYNRDSSDTNLVHHYYTGARTLVSNSYSQITVNLTRYSSAGNYMRFDRFRRVREQFWDGYSGTADVDRIYYPHDYAGNRLARNIHHSIYPANDKDQGYSYEGLHRLAEMKRGTWNGSAITSPNFEQEWSIDQGRGRCRIPLFWRGASFGRSSGTAATG